MWIAVLQAVHDAPLQHLRAVHPENGPSLVRVCLCLVFCAQLGVCGCVACDPAREMVTAGSLFGTREGDFTDSNPRPCCLRRSAYRRIACIDVRRSGQQPMEYVPYPFALSSVLVSPPRQRPILAPFHAFHEALLSMASLKLT